MVEILSKISLAKMEMGVVVVLGEKGKNSISIKKENRYLVLSTIKNSNGISRVDLAKKLGLSKGGLTPIVTELIKQKLVVETETIDTDSGRKPIMLEINSNNYFAVAVSWTRRYVDVAIANIKGTIIKQEKIFFDKDEKIDVVIEHMKSLIYTMLKYKEKSQCIGIGVVAPGPIDYENGIILNPPNFNNWRYVNIKKILQDEFGLVVTLDNNANAFALAEQAYGFGKMFDSFINIIVDEGVGAGIVINNQLFRGTRGLGNEIGHMSIDINGSECQCGNKGCVELYTSIPQIMENIKKLASEKDDKHKKYYNNLTWDDVVRLLEMDDELCRQAMELEAKYLATVFISISNVFAPSAIIIGSDLAQAKQYITEPIRKKVSNKIIAGELYKVQIITSNLTNSSLLGGTMEIIDLFFKNDFDELELKEEDKPNVGGIAK